MLSQIAEILFCSGFYSEMIRNKIVYFQLFLIFPRNVITVRLKVIIFQHARAFFLFLFILFSFFFSLFLLFYLGWRRLSATISCKLAAPTLGKQTNKANLDTNISEVVSILRRPTTYESMVVARDIALRLSDWLPSQLIIIKQQLFCSGIIFDFNHETAH